MFGPCGFDQSAACHAQCNGPADVLRCATLQIPSRASATALHRRHCFGVLLGTCATVQHACSSRRLQILGCAVGQKIMVEAQQWVAAHHPYVKSAGGFLCTPQYRTICFAQTVVVFRPSHRCSTGAKLAQAYPAVMRSRCRYWDKRHGADHIMMAFYDFGPW